MHTKTYRAKSMQEALELIRRDLGPDASVLHTREVSSGLMNWVTGSRQIEVTASANVNVPSRMAHHLDGTNSRGDVSVQQASRVESTRLQAGVGPVQPAHEVDYRAMFRQNLKDQPDCDLHTMMESLGQTAHRSSVRELPAAMFHLFTDLIDAEVSEELARDLIDRVRVTTASTDLDDIMLLKARIARMIEEEINVCPPIKVTPGQPRLVALVGPTGVGKTTTIAKLAANFRLRDKHRVGLITVDTYRIAAVEQLRTYADIMDLPMEVVSTPREMRTAVDRLANLDLILLDTAGRSPRDEVKIQELKSMLAEAKADEVHLVLSVVAGTSTMRKAAEKFAEVGATALILTKLDETDGLGTLLPLLRSCQIPLSYTTNGQNVPDDISQADKRKLARSVLGMEC